VSIWNQDRLGGQTGKRHMLGLWDPRHKMSSAAWMPGTAERRKLRGKTPFWYALSFNVNGAQGGTYNDRFTVTSDFYLTTITAVYFGFGGFPPVFGYSLSLFETKTKRRFMSLPLTAELFGGGLGPTIIDSLGSPRYPDFPFYCRKIVKIPGGSNMNMLAKFVPDGVAIGTQPVQVVLGGYVD
jgi:hypothetical protein